MQILKNRVLVQFDSPPETSRSGLIIIPSEARDPSYTGLVLAIGPEQFNVFVGQRILFSRYAGVPIEHRFVNGSARPTAKEKSMCVVLDDSEILAVFEHGEGVVRSKRVTFALDMTSIVSEALYREGEEWMPGQATVYANYVHANDTLYVTIERPLIREVVDA